MAVGIGYHKGSGKAVSDNDSGFGDDFTDKVTDQVGKGLRGIVNRGTVREAEAQQINHIDAELRGESINVLAPLVGRGTRAEAVNEQERSGMVITLHLIKHVAIFPWITPLLTGQH